MKKGFQIFSTESSFPLSHFDCTHNQCTDYDYRIAGTYLSFETTGKEKLTITKGIISIKDGMINDISPYKENVDGVEYLTENEVIYPGLLDIHSHAESNYFQMFSDQINVETAWDNRFEWQNSPKYDDIYKKPNRFMHSQWQETFGDSDSSITLGDMVAWYAELQAVSGGTVLLQEDGNSTYYPFLDNHRKIRMIRSTSDGNDLKREDGAGLLSIVRLYKPDHEFDKDHTVSYMPHQDTTKWKIVDVKDMDHDTPMMETVIDIISGQYDSIGGCIVHLAEGRASNLSNENSDFTAKDDYTSLEFQTFKKEIEKAVREGRITEKQVQRTNIVLIHACTVDLEDPEEVQFLKKYKIALNWSPVSNLLLYEDTPDFYRYLDHEELTIAIGSDWSPSSSKTVWDECKFAYDFIRAREVSLDQENLKANLLKGATINAARSIGCSKLGNIKEGNAADLMIIDTKGAQPLDAFYSCDESNIQMVFVDGKPVYGDQAFYTGHISNADQLTLVKISSKVEKLNDKFYNISGICDAENFNQLLDAFMGIVHKAGIETSAFRSQEDDTYLEVMERLRLKYGTKE